MKKLLIVALFLFTLCTELAKPYSTQEISYLAGAVPAYVLEKGTPLNHNDFTATFPTLQGIIDEIKRDRSSGITETFATIAATIGSKSKAPMEIAAGVLYYFGVMADSHKNICMLLTIVQAINELQAQKQSIKFSVVMEAAEALALRFGGKPNFTNLITNAKPTANNDADKNPDYNKRIIKVLAIGAAVIAVIVILGIYFEQEKQSREEKRKLAALQWEFKQLQQQTGQLTAAYYNINARQNSIESALDKEYEELRRAIGLAGQAVDEVKRTQALLTPQELGKLGKQISQLQSKLETASLDKLTREVEGLRREHADLSSAMVNLQYKVDPRSVAVALQ